LCFKETATFELTKKGAIANALQLEAARVTRSPFPL